MSCEADFLQSRNLKRTKLGPPDVYPQLKDQREDKLNELALKKGFSNPPVAHNECGSARDRIKAKGLSSIQHGLLSSTKELAKLKNNLNTVNDNGTRKIQTIQRDQFWSVNPRSNRQSVKKFFTDLSLPGKSLSALVKSRIPSFQKKEEILDHMAEFQVPVLRAIWFMKITAVHVASISKKRHTCVALEWTRCITEYLRDNLGKFAEQPCQVDLKSTLNTGNKAVQEATAAKNRWNYTLRLCHCMYQDGLLDKQEFLLFLIKWVVGLKIADKEEILRHLIQVMLTYFDDVSDNFTLARAAAYMCVNKLNGLSEIKSVRSSYDWDSAVKECHIPARSDCPYHDSLLLIFSSVLQRINLVCPTALVYQRTWTSPLGLESVVISKESPLDNLPCYPASLPFAKSLTEQDREQLRYQISEGTEDVRARSVIAEERWIMGEEACPPSVIPMLTTLDEHNFYQAQIGGSVAGLYKRVFGPINKPPGEQIKEDAPIVVGLCEWAVTHRRTGSHRRLVVAELLKKRQGALESVVGKKGKREEFLFQGILFKYLNEAAPTWTGKEEEGVQFSNLMNLLGELVRQVFSYEKYLKKLISRGDLPMRLSKFNMTGSQDFTLLCKELHTLPRHIQYVFSLPLPDTHKDELKHRSLLLFGSNGVQASQPVEYMVTHKELRAALLSLGPSNTSPYATLQELGPVIERFRLFPPVYKYMISQRLMEPILPPDPKTLGSEPIKIPTVHQVELLYFLMELAGDVRSMMLLSIELMNRLSGLRSLPTYNQAEIPLELYLCIISVLKKYQTCVLIFERDIEFVFDGLNGVTKEDSPICAAERCILIYRQELYRASPKLTNNREEPTSPRYSNLKKPRLKEVPNNINGASDEFIEAVRCPRLANVNDISSKIASDEAVGQSFVSTVILELCSGYDKHSLPELVSLCAELTTKHVYLEGVWVSAIYSPQQCGTIPEGTAWWTTLSLFVILMLRYQCFSLWWIMYYVIYPNLYNIYIYCKFSWPNTYHVVHLMLALFTQLECPDPGSVDDSIMLQSAFRHLHADRRALKTPRFVTMLKLLITNSDTQQDIPEQHKGFQALNVLRSMCSQSWVPELCLSTPEKLVDNYLADKEITPHMAQMLLHLICDPQSTEPPSADPTELIGTILKTADKWTVMWSSHLKVRLIRVRCKEREGDGEDPATLALKLITDAVVNTLGAMLAEIAKGVSKNSTLWLLPSLINKLHDQVKEHLTQWLGEWLGEGSWWQNDFTFCVDFSWQQPLLALMTGCLSNKLHLILRYLMTQLKRFVDEVKDLDQYTSLEVEQINTALHFRLSLVGAHFHHVQSNTILKLDWGLLLLRLVRHPAVDSTRLGEGILFYSILDMLSTIMESLEVMCYTTEDATARTMFFKKICNEIHDVDNPVNLQVRQLLKIPLYREEITVVEHTSVNEEWSQRPTSHYEKIYPELRREGYVPVSKHTISPWELVEKGGCNPVPWQELGAVRHDKHVDQLEERLCVTLRGHTHDLPPLDHEQVILPAAPKPKLEPSEAQQFANFQNRPPMMMPGSKQRMLRPMQPGHFSGIMGAPAPNVTITQQGPVPAFNPLEQQGQFGFEGASSGPSGSQAHQYPGTQSMQMGSSSTGFLDTAGGMVRGPYPPQQQHQGPTSSQPHMIRTQFMSEQQKMQMLDQQQRMHPGMVFPGQPGPNYLPQHMNSQAMPSTRMANPRMTNPGMGAQGMNQQSQSINTQGINSTMDQSGFVGQNMMNQQSHQFIHRPLMGVRAPAMAAPASMPVSMASLSSGQMIMSQPSDPSYSQTSFFDQQFN